MKTTFNEIMRVNCINFTLTKPSKKITAHSFLSLISYFTLFKSYLATLTLCFVFANSVFGQVTTNSGSGLAASYPSLDAAISALNAATITSPVVITMNSGATETAPAGGLVITQSGTATFPITIEGFSNLSRNVITASTAQVSGSVTDAVFKLVGADYLTIRYFEVKENDLNTTRDPITSNNKTEFGIALMANSATNGSQNNTITDNTINLGTTAYENSFGIYSQCVHQSTSLSAQTATNNTGINSNNNFNANTISNAVVGIGILITRPGSTFGLTNNSITNNTINLIPSPGTFANYIDWLPGQRSSGIETRSVLGITVTGNTISQTGNILNALYGINITHIQFPLSTLNYTETVNNNIITLSQKSNNDLKGIDISNNNSVSGTLIANGNNINLSILNSGTSTSIVRGIDFGVIAGNISATTNVVEIANTHAATISLDISAIYGGGILSSSSTNTLMSNNTCKISLLQTAGEASGEVTGVSIGAAAGANTSINATTNTVEITGTSSGTGNITSKIYYIRTLSNAANLSLTDNVLKTTTGGEIKTAGSVFGIQHNHKFSSSVLVTGNTININRTGSFGDVYGLHGNTTIAASSSYACNLNLITLSGLSGSTSCHGIYNTDSGINKEVNSNTINISGTNTGSTTGILSSCTSLNPSTSNNIISISTSSSATVGINTTARTNGLCDANNIQVTTNSSVASPDLKGITCTSGSGPYAISNNLIHALSSTDAGTSSSEISGINAGISGITLSIHSNTISDFNTGATTGNPKIRGIIIKSAGTNSIYKNKIYNLSTSATGVATGVEGININSSNTGAINTIYNNIIGNLTSPASGNSECIRGIVIAGTSASTIHKVYFNTIYLSGTSTGTNFGGSGIYQTSHNDTMKYALDLRNNNIVNTIVPKGTGSTKTVALRRSGTASLNYELTSNHNNLYGTSGAYYNGTIYNIADFKTHIGPHRDSASIAVLPNFISTVGSDANYLHIEGTIPTLIGNGGKPIGSVLLDFDGEVRSLTNPDIGADEFISVAPDCAVYISPANGATDQSTSNLTLSWTPSTGTSGYDVYFDQNPTPTTLISSNQVGATYNTGVLSVNTTYYWQIVPKNLSGSATGCAVWSFTTINPTLSTTPTSLVFANQCINTPSSEQTFKMNATNLDGTFVTITAPLGLKVSADNVTYSSSINVNHTSGSFTNKTIYVKYTANSSAAFSNNIVISGGGLTSAVDVAVSATTLTATPSFVATATGATLVTGDYLWNGLTSIAWDNAVNWYQYNGTAFEESSNIPLATDRVFILPSSAGNNCITATNTATVNVLAGNGNANDFFIGSGATVVIDASKTLAIKGNWTNNGTFSPASTSNVTFDGNLAQSIGGSNSTTFSSLTINNNSNTLTLNKPVSVLETLTMTSGNIKSTATNLLTIGNSTTNPGSIAWSEGAIVGPLKRYFSSVASSTQDSGIFPVGKNNLNRYAQINYTSGLSTGGTITAEYIQGVCPVAYAGLPATVSGALIQNYEEEGYWSIAASGGNLNAATYTLKLRGNALSSPSSITTLRIIKSVNHTSWDNAGIGMHAAATGSNSDFIITNSGLTGFSWFNIGSNNANPLPVKLLNFKASCKENQVNLNWATGSERNSAIFIVDRSTDLTTWQQVNIQKAAGNSSQKIDYHATDDQAQQGVNYYRLTQIDLNGEQEVFDPISIQCANNNVDVIIYPNPSTGNFTLEIESLTKQTQVNIQLSDLTGKKLEQRVVNLKAGNNEFNFLVNLKAGIYLIQVENSHVNYPVLKLEIQH